MKNYVVTQIDPDANDANEVSIACDADNLFVLQIGKRTGFDEVKICKAKDMRAETLKAAMKGETLHFKYAFIQIDIADKEGKEQ